MMLPILFPNLTDFDITSSNSPYYNCIAWVFGDTQRKWWPHKDYYWPRPYPTEEEIIQDFVDAFSDFGYEVCADGSLEVGYEKIAIYADDGEPTHASKQLPNGRWTSKLGDLQDIEHSSPEQVYCRTYGEVVRYMRRTIDG